MKNVALIISGNVHWFPYLRRYLQVIEHCGLTCTIFYWNRENINESFPPFVKPIEFKKDDKTNNGSPFKIFKFLKYGSFLKKELSKTHFDRLIFLGTYSFIPAILYKILTKKYSKKYWIDIRDLTYESFPLFYYMEKRVFYHSYMTVVSSDGFVKYLPKYNYGHVHNIDPSLKNHFDFSHNKTDKIRISYIGNISYFEEVKKLVDFFKNDGRFFMNFYGKNSNVIKDYCTKHRITNVSFKGPFRPEETISLYENTDVIFNAYGNKRKNLRVALANKLYYSIRLNIPLLVSPNTYTSYLCRKNGIGIDFIQTSTFKEDLISFVNSYRAKNTNVNFALWRSIVNEDNQTFSNLEVFLQN